MQRFYYKPSFTAPMAFQNHLCVLKNNQYAIFEPNPDACYDKKNQINKFIAVFFHFSFKIKFKCKCIHQILLLLMLWFSTPVYL